MADAPRLVIVWERAGLQEALGILGPPLPTGLVVLDASKAVEHVVGWYPAELAQTSTRPDGFPVVTTE